jgi:LeuA allosteric (dimerisation) domain
VSDAIAGTGDAAGTGSGPEAGAPLPPIRLERWTVTSGSNVNSRAAVVLHAGRHDWKGSAEGNGAVDALLRAVDKALADVLGGHPVLIAYDVHALAEGPDAKGQVTVRIAPPAAAEGARSDGRYTGEVASTNIVAASVEAYVEALNAMLDDPSWAGVAEAAGSRRGRGRGAEPGGGAGAEFDDDARPIDTTEWFNL